MFVLLRRKVLADTQGLVNVIRYAWVKCTCLPACLPAICAPKDTDTLAR